MSGKHHHHQQHHEDHQKMSQERATVFLIRHGEKPESGNGLSAAGATRSELLPGVFGKGSDYNIGKIMAEKPLEGRVDGDHERPLETVTPLSQNLEIPVDISCDRDDYKGVANKVNDYNGNGNILICWEHKALKHIAKHIGASNAEDYPDKRFDLIWTLPYPYDMITSITPEGI